MSWSGLTLSQRLKRAHELYLQARSYYDPFKKMPQFLRWRVLAMIGKSEEERDNLKSDVEFVLQVWKREIEFQTNKPSAAEERIAMAQEMLKDVERIDGFREYVKGICGDDSLGCYDFGSDQSVHDFSRILGELEGELRFQLNCVAQYIILLADKDPSIEDRATKFECLDEEQHQNLFAGTTLPNVVKALLGQLKRIEIGSDPDSRISPKPVRETTESDRKGNPTITLEIKGGDVPAQVPMTMTKDRRATLIAL